MPVALAHAVACAGDILSDGSGRCRVRAMIESYGISMIWLKEFADAESKKVPVHAAATMGTSIVPGDMTCPQAVVTTTRPLSRLLLSSM